MPQPPSKRRILDQSKLFSFATRTPPRPKPAAVTAVDAQLPLPPRNNSNRKQGEQTATPATPATPLPVDTQQLPPPLNERNDDLKKLKQQGDETATPTKSTPAVLQPVDAQQLPLPPPLNERNYGDGIVEPDSSTSSPFPDLWSDKMWKERKGNYPWLDFKDGKLGCKVCSSITDFSVLRTQGSRLSTEWTNYEITHNGRARSAMLMSIRKKVCAHNNSDAHNKAEHIVNEAKKQRIEKLLA